MPRMRADLSSLQPDLAQRYRLVGEILALIRPASPDGRLRLLDLGAGPESLVDSVMPPWCDLHRADVAEFGRDDLTRLEPGRPLPFASGSFDVVLTLEVLEHVPVPDRPLFLDECLRVASRVVILSTPLGTDTTRRLEAAFRASAEQLTGRSVPFLEEHAAYGLPDPELTAVALARHGARVVTLDNAPAAEWLIGNLVDFVYAALIGDGDEKAAHNVVQNRQLPMSRAGTAHYRHVYCASREAEDVAALATLRERQASEGVTLTVEALAEFTAQRLTTVIRDIEARHGRHLAIKDTRVGQLEERVRALDDVLVDLQEGLERQKKHSAKLDTALTAQNELTSAAERQLAAAKVLEATLRQQIHGGQETIARLAAAEASLSARLTAAETEREAREALRAVAAREQQEHEQRASAESEQLRLQLLALEDAMAEERRLHGQQARELAQARLQLRRTDAELTATRHSTTWRATAPLRKAVAQGQALALQGAVQWRRFRQRGKPASAWPPALSRRILAASGLFDSVWYLSTYGDVAAAGLDPLDHFLSSGASEGRRPNALFDTAYYCSRYPDVGTSGINPLVHYALYGAREGRWVNSAFDSGYYLRTYADVARSRLTPLAHYLRFGAAEGRHPSATFDPEFYLEANPDVRESGASALEHYVLAGALEGRLGRALSSATRPPAPGATMPPAESYLPPPGLLPWFSPLNTVLDPSLSGTPRLNVLVPGLGMRHMSGGPNTVLAFVGRLAAQGIPLRLVSTDAPADDDPAPFWAHLTSLAGGTLPSGIELVDAHDRSTPWRLGEHDLFLASAWWTAQQVKYASRLTRTSRFLYFIQDYEPLLHAASTAQALAEETYALDYVPVLNTRVLADFFAERRIGRFADPTFARDAIVFEPALDRALFHPAVRTDRTRRRLLFYARPTNGLRNLFELGVAALQQAVATGVLPAEQWEFVGMGEAFAAVDLGHGAVLRPAPWLGLQGYADQMRESDVLLSLMLSPHPSYPPLEMAACGGVAVTTVYANKDAARLSAMSSRILGVPATIEGLVSGLARAVVTPPADQRAVDRIALPESWDDAFTTVVADVAARLWHLIGVPFTAPGDHAPPVPFPGYAWPRQAYDVQRLHAIERRAREYASPAHPLLFSIITPVWNTDPDFLEALCLSVLRQDCPADLFEWVVVDNASARAETRAVLDRWAAVDPRLRVHRADKNLGILGGLRACLERAGGRYVVTVDHDDLLTPDALRVLAHVLAAHGFPPLAYSDEDKMEGRSLRDSYHKPDWDPVLFAHSCYTSHVGVLDRQLALELGAYTDPQTEGSHDWDSFVRFTTAGMTPVHVPEVLYTWRMHEESTAGNIHAKPYVFDSQRRVLEKFVAASSQVPCDVVPSELFPGTPDWRLLARSSADVVTAVCGPAGLPAPRIAVEPGVRRTVVEVSSRAELEQVARRAVAATQLLHLACRGLDAEDGTWAREATSLLALFPDACMVGGPLLCAGRVVDGARVAGVGRGLDAVDRGRFAHDPGYFAQAWKPHTVTAVPASHLVIDPSFLLEVIESLPAAAIEAPWRLGPWLGAAAARRERRVVYSPFFRAVLGAPSLAAAWEEAELGPVLALGDGLGRNDLWSPHFAFSLRAGIVARDPDVDVDPLSAPDLHVDTYAAWLEADRLARRLLLPQHRPVLPAVGLLTSVWMRTPADHFAATVDSVLAQSVPPVEWIILRNGPVEADVEAVLARARASGFVRVVDVAENVGIIGAMRVCLAAATADYVLPLDADDLLEHDALEVLASWASAHDADVVFSDEDLLTNDVPEQPFLRPDFDPVLHAESAYVWHACLFRRDRALAVGAYEDRGAEYCHDWDTLLRMDAAGMRIVHAPHILYHWRMHGASHSNSGQQHPGTVASTRHVLEQTIATLPHPERYRVADYPRHRGLQEWYIERLPHQALPLVLIHVHDESDNGELVADVPAVVRITVAAGPDFRTGLARAIADVPSEALVAVVAGAVAEIPAAGVWDAIKLFEMHPTVQAVGGRLVTSAGLVVEAGSVCLDQGTWADPYAGRPANDPGPYALALKAHCIDRTAAGLSIVRAGVLRSAVEHETVRDLDTLSTTVAALLLARAQRIAFTPLLEGIVAEPHRGSRRPAVDTRAFRSVAGATGHRGNLPVRHGAAALTLYRRRRGLA